MPWYSEFGNVTKREWSKMMKNQKASHAGSVVQVSEIGWSKSLDGNWTFHHYCDESDRFWEHEQDGFVSVAAGHRIEGYCIKGQENKWKNKLLDSVIKSYKNDIKFSIQKIEELSTLKCQSNK